MRPLRLAEADLATPTLNTTEMVDLF